MRGLLTVSITLTIACAGGEIRDRAGDVDAGTVVDAGTPGPAFDPPAKCAQALQLNKTVELDTVGRVQTRPSAAFDGHVWLSYSRGDLDNSGGFDVFLARLGCDGSLVQEPTRVNTATGTNDSASHVAASTKGAVVVWSTDDSDASPLNLTLRMRLLSAAGVPAGETETILKTTQNAVETDANAWMPTLTLLPDGFAVGGSRATTGATSFNAFVQRYATDGTRVGETIDLPSDPAGHHADPAIAALADGTLVAAFTRDEDFDSPEVVHTRLAAGSSTRPPSPSSLSRVAAATTRRSPPNTCRAGGRMSRSRRSWTASPRCS